MQVLITENDRKARTITNFLLKPNQIKNLVTYHSKTVTKTDFFSLRTFIPSESAQLGCLEGWHKRNMKQQLNNKSNCIPIEQKLQSGGGRSCDLGEDRNGVLAARRMNEQK